MSYKTLLHILISLALIAIVIIVSVHLSFILYFNNDIKQRIQEEIKNQTDGGYEAQIEKLSVNIFEQSIYIKVFTLKSLKETNSPTIFASAGEINLLDFKLFPLLLRKDLTISKVELINSSGYIFRPPPGGRMIAKDEKEKFSMYNLARKFVRSLTIKKIDVSDSDIRIFNYKDRSVPLIASKNNHLRIANLQLNQSIEESGRHFLADSMYLQINRIAYATPDGLYSVLIKRLTASYTQYELILDSLRLVPKFSKKAFAAKAGQQTDRFLISAESAAFEGMNVKSFVERNWFIARKLKIKGLDISAYRDKKRYTKA